MNLIKGDFFNPNTLTLIRLFETSFFLGGEWSSWVNFTSLHISRRTNLISTNINITLYNEPYTITLYNLTLSDLFIEGLK